MITQDLVFGWCLFTLCLLIEYTTSLADVDDDDETSNQSMQSNQI